MAKKQILTFWVKNSEGNSSNEQLELNLTCLEKNANYIVHRALIKQLNNKRQGTLSTKTRSEVRGGGRKPWKQKGTGRARAGSNRSPLWRSGGITFGPKPKFYDSKINKKEFRLALHSLLFNRREEIMVINDFSLSSPRTKEFLKQLRNLNVNISKKLLIVVSKKDSNLLLASRNISTIELILAENLNIFSILRSDQILLFKSTLSTISRIYTYDEKYTNFEF